MSMKSKLIFIFRNEKISNEFNNQFEKIKGTVNKDSDSLSELVQTELLSKKQTNENSYLFLPIKILQKLGNSIEKGAFFSKNFFIRKEIWNQSNAKIEGLHQKYETYKAIFEKIDNLTILSKKNVVNTENIDKFCDMLIDIQNNISKEFTIIKPCAFPIKHDPGQSGFYKKFSDISTKIKNNLLSSKLSARPDYLEYLLKMINKTQEIESIFANPNFKKEDESVLRERKVQISMFFYHTIFKLIMQDVRDLTLRFLKKKIISFENK